MPIKILVLGAGGGGECTWVKPGRFGSFFVLCFLALGGHCLQMLCLPGFGTHANTQNLPHFRAFLASIQEHSPSKCLFFMANAKLPNRPGFALLQRGEFGCFLREEVPILVTHAIAIRNR